MSVISELLSKIYVYVILVLSSFLLVLVFSTWYFYGEVQQARTENAQLTTKLTSCIANTDACNGKLIEQNMTIDSLHQEKLALDTRLRQVIGKFSNIDNKTNEILSQLGLSLPANTSSCDEYMAYLRNSALRIQK